MPHTTIEHSFNIPKEKIDFLLLAVNQNIAKNEGNFDILQCKARSVFCPNFLIADGSISQDFMHITIKIMQGRNEEIRKKLAVNILQIVGDFLKDNNLFANPENSIALSLDIREMEKEIYQKTVLKPNS